MNPFAVEKITAAEMSARSATALAAPLVGAGTFCVEVATDAGLLLGALDRWQGEGACFRRGTGGPLVRISPGSIRVALVLRAPNALVDIDVARVANRHVRPLLRAMSRALGPVVFGGREFISCRGSPVAFVGVGHVAETGRTLFEAILSGAEPCFVSNRPASGPPRALFEDARVSRLSSEALAEQIMAAYTATFGAARLQQAEACAPVSEPLPKEPPWTALCEEAIGVVGAGSDRDGRFRVGGEFFASEDVVRAIERGAVLCGPPHVGRCVETCFVERDGYLHGVRNRDAITDVVSRALTVEIERGVPLR